MKRKRRIASGIAVLTLLLLILALPAEAATEAGEYTSEFEQILPDELSGITEEGKVDSMIGPEALLGEILTSLSGEITRIGSFCLLLLSGICLVGVTAVKGGRLSESASLGVSVIIGAEIVKRLVPVITEISQALSSATSFFGAFIPIASAIQISSGAVRSGAVSAVGMNVTVSVISGLGEPFFLALSGFGFALGLISYFGSATNLCASVKKFFMWCIGLVCALIMGVLALQTFMASARDSAAMRAARYAASSLIPVVGGTVSGAMATLSTGLSYVKSTVGVGAVAVLLTLLLSPLVILLLYRLALSLCASFAEHLGITRAAGLYSATLQGLDLFIAIYSISSVIYIFEVGLFLSFGVSG